jgi:hypothetical protein
LATLERSPLQWLLYPVACTYKLKSFAAVVCFALS